MSVLRILWSLDNRQVDTSPILWCVIGLLFSRRTHTASIQSTHINPPPKAIAVFYGMGGDFLLDMHVVPKKVGLNQWDIFGLLKRINRKNISTGSHS